MAGHRIVHRQHHHAALAHRQSRPQGAHDPGRLLVGRLAVLVQCRWIGHDDAVDHGLDVVDLVAVHPESRLEFHDFPVHAGPEVALLLDRFEELPVVPFPAPDEGREEQEPLPGVVLDDARQDAFIGEADHGLPGGTGIRRGRPGEEHAEEVEQFGHRSDRGPRIAADGLLLDGDDRTQPRDALHLGPLESAHELAGVGAEGLEVTALAFGVQGVERQTGFSRSAHASHHDEPVPGDVHVDVLQVVFRSAFDPDGPVVL